MKFFISLTFFLLVFLPQVFAQSFPTAEKITSTSSAPLDILNSQPDGILVTAFGDFKDEYIITFDSNAVTIISTMTWEEISLQPESFSTSIVDVALLSNGTSLIIALSDGDLARIELDDTDTFENTTEESEDEEDEELDSRVYESSLNMSSAGLSAIATDPSASTEIIYMLNGSSGYYYEFNLATETLAETQIADDALDSDDSDSTGTAVTLEDILFAESSAGDRIILSSADGRIFSSEPGAFSFTEVTATPPDTENDDTPVFSQMALHPDNNHVFALDTANDFVWVYNIQSKKFMDQISGGGSTDPIEVTDNSALTNIAIFGSTSDSNVTAYVSGGSGVTLIDANAPSTSASNKLIDTDDSTSSTYDPIDTSGTPGPIAASSSTDGFIYSANGDASISILTDNPFPTITALDTTTVTEASSTFTITFQSDETGTYTVRANSSPDASAGTELQTAADVATEDTDISFTLDINDFDRAVFTEGENIVSVFVTDTDGNIGRDGVILTVDRPPGAITITALQFGNQRLIVTFTPSTDNDIQKYIFYATPAEDQSSPSCPGSLVFSESGTVASELEGSQCVDDNGDALSSCQAQIKSLTNGIWYCVAAQATDNGGQTGVLTGSSLVMRPELTVGPAGYLGETGCSLQINAARNHTVLVMTALFLFLLTYRWRTQKILSLIIFLVPFFLFSDFARADLPEKNDNVDFTFELKSGNWIPTDSGMKTFFNACCQIPVEAEFGVILNNRFNITGTAGFMTKSGPAIGSLSGGASFDKFRLSTIPLRLDFIYRMYFNPTQIFEPYFRAGFDAVLFRESTSGNNIDGVKFGVHGALGLGIELMDLDNTKIERDFSVESVKLVLEGRYSQINSFKSTGVDFSGITPYLGVLFQF